jgi:hypothetical protein
MDFFIILQEWIDVILEIQILYNTSVFLVVSQFELNEPISKLLKSVSPAKAGVQKKIGNTG